MLTHINKSHINNWNRLINATIRIKALLPNTFPTSAIKHPNIYNTCDINDLQAKSKISELYIQLNSDNIAGTTTKIRLANLQHARWSTFNILENPQWKSINLVTI